MIRQREHFKAGETFRESGQFLSEQEAYSEQQDKLAVTKLSKRN